MVILIPYVSVSTTRHRLLLVDTPSTLYAGYIFFSSTVPSIVTKEIFFSSMKKKLEDAGFVEGITPLPDARVPIITFTIDQVRMLLCSKATPIMITQSKTKALNINCTS